LFLPSADLDDSKLAFLRSYNIFKALSTASFPLAESYAPNLTSVLAAKAIANVKTIIANDFIL